MHLIVYTSEFTRDSSEADAVLSDIVGTAKKRNPSMGVTGLLFYHNRRFVQVIEGEKDSLEELIAILVKDNRHKNIERLVDQAIMKRGFREWNMDSFNLDSTDTISADELTNITNAYKANIQMDSEILVTVYKALLKSQ